MKIEHLDSDFTRLYPVKSLVHTVKGPISYLEWCQKEVARIGPKASVRIVPAEEGIRVDDYCCVNLEGFVSKE
jgi:anionic cell wall polymer biosynthesis LytR-Cps2A-Psr (LCP) family protein